MSFIEGFDVLKDTDPAVRGAVVLEGVALFGVDEVFIEIPDFEVHRPIRRLWHSLAISLRLRWRPIAVFLYVERVQERSKSLQVDSSLLAETEVRARHIFFEEISQSFASMLQPEIHFQVSSRD